MNREYDNSLYGKSYIGQEKDIVNKWMILFSISFVIPVVFGISVIFEMIDSGCGLYLLIFACTFGFGVFLNAKLLFKIAFESGVLYRNYEKVSPDYNFEEKEQNSILFMHILNLKRMWKRSGRKEVSQDSLIEVLHAKLKNEGSQVLLISSIMITIGLIGTVSGLISSIGGLKEAMGDGGISEGLSSALNGVGIAFYTTLVGSILGGVCLKVLCSYVDSKIDSYILGLAEVVEISVIPAYRRDQDKTDINKIVMATVSALEDSKIAKGVYYEVA